MDKRRFDGIFFLLVGLELKREVMEGELSDLRSVMLPALGAIGGMVVPGVIFIAFNHTDPVAIKGWAIPTATDIAFALGILALLGSRVPVSLKIFLTSLAIFDDIGAILIIAFFYTAKISSISLFIAGLCVLGLFPYLAPIASSNIHKPALNPYKQAINLSSILR